MQYCSHNLNKFDARCPKIRNDPILKSKLRHLAFRSSLHSSPHDCEFLAIIALNYESEAEIARTLKNHAVDQEDARLLLEDYIRRISWDTSVSTFDIGLALTIVPWIQDTLVWYNQSYSVLGFVLAEIESLWRVLSLNWIKNQSAIGPIEGRFFEVLATRVFNFIL